MVSLSGAPSLLSFVTWHENWNRATERFRLLPAVPSDLSIMLYLLVVSYQHTWRTLSAHLWAELVERQVCYMRSPEERGPLPAATTGFGQRLRWLRLQHHLSQEALAEAIGASSMSIRRWEHNLALPQPATRQQLCRVFGLEPDALLGEPAPPEAAFPSTPWQVPFRRNPFFTGQGEVMARLATLFLAGHAVALCGLGGIGKSQMAVEYAYRQRQQYRAVLWARAETRETLQADLASAASLLGLAEQREADRNAIVAAVRRWLSRQNGWLLVLDNVEELALVEEVLPAPAPGHLLLTTRLQALAGLAEPLEVDALPAAEGALFLLRRAGLLARDAPLVNDQTIKSAQTLAQRLGGLPLALDQAGAFLEETGCRLEEYLARSEQQQVALLQRRGQRAQDHPEPVSTTFSLAWEQVQRVHPVAADLLQLSAFLAPDAIPEELLTRGTAALSGRLAALATDPLALDEACAALRRASLVRRHPESQTLTIHRLVQAVLRAHLDAATQRVWAEQATRVVKHAFPDLRYETWSACERLLPQVLACAAILPETALNLELAELLVRAAGYLQVRAQYKQAEPLYQRALSIQEQALGPAHPEAARVLNNLAILYGDQGKAGMAEAAYRRALDIWEQTLGPEHPNVAATLNGLANLYGEQGQYEANEALLRRALHIWEQALGPAHPQLAVALTNLADTLRVQAFYEEAETLYRRALQVREQALGPTHPNLAYTLNGLADLAREQRQFEQAEALYRRALQVREQALGPTHPNLAYTLNGLADLAREKGQFEQAEALYQRALTISEQALGPAHPQVAFPLDGLARLAGARGRGSDAAILYHRALAIRLEQLAPDHPATAYTLAGLAAVRWQQGELVEALRLFEQALLIQNQRLGAQHPHTVQTHIQYKRLVARLEQKEGLARNLSEPDRSVSKSP